MISENGHDMGPLISQNMFYIKTKTFCKIHASLLELKTCLQIVCSWLITFIVNNTFYLKASVMSLKVTLRDTKPVIKHRVNNKQ